MSQEGDGRTSKKMRDMKGVGEERQIQKVYFGITAKTLGFTGQIFIDGSFSD